MGTSISASTPTSTRHLSLESPPSQPTAPSPPRRPLTAA
jgi:hypothetical protein